MSATALTASAYDYVPGNLRKVLDRVARQVG